ncbi:hypothetical protein J1N35_016605 [Gossypium stocksii]|uniref:P-type Ca(2+) transporter n=1 Tax=Gossypium stocksii TaxID=47602 RepID=A0A9D4A4Y4_9ROSI|nr:hypothetical protein J1N35_016605 [Gossypium stocksii]
MTTILQSKLLCFEYTIQVPSATFTKSRKKWHSLFATIYCSRKFSSLITKTVTANDEARVVHRSPSHVSLAVMQENSPFRIDQPTLIELVKEKKIEKLRKHGGVDGVASGLGTDAQVGVSGSAEDIERRREAFGSNTYKKPPTKGFFHFVVEAFKDLTIMILLGCATLSLGFGIKEHGLKDGWYDGGSIFVAVFLVIAVSAVSNYRQNRQFDKLSKVSNNIQVDVVRGGRRQQISIFDIVVGDCVCLNIGDQVPADGLFIDGHSLQIDESSMTGESDHVEVNGNQNPFLLSGTKVADGYAWMLVTSVGMNTTWGQMMCQISRDTNDETPLQSRLNKLTSSIGKVGLAVAFLVLVVLLVRYFTGHTTDENGNREFKGSKTKSDDIINAVVGIVAAAVTIVVVAIPEGLPLAVTLTLAYSMKRMMADQAMVRKLSACETMGSATTICTDKTGTLTLNQMKVTKFWLGQESMEEGASSISPFVVDVIHQGVALNTTGNVYRASPGTEYEFSGSPTEKAILSWAVVELKMDIEKTKKCSEVLQVEAFNSQKKRSGVLIGRNDDDTVHKGHVVAVTGDGTNDAPALKEADIGLSMGIQGTEVAKESSDIVILDDNFASVATVLRWGRCVYTNIQKFIQFQLTVNVAALCINFVAAVSAGEVPLTAVQLLWVNLIMDTLGALALATERPTKELMEKPPVGRTEPLITNIMWRNLLAQALYQIAILLTLQFSGESILGVTEKVNDTLIFNIFVFCQVFNEFNARKLEKKNVFEGIHKNKLFMGIIGVTILLQVVMVEFLKRFADTERLSWGQWGACIAVAAVSWPLGWVVKCLPVPQKPIFSYLKWRK